MRRSDWTMMVAAAVLGDRSSADVRGRRLTVAATSETSLRLVSLSHKRNQVKYVVVAETSTADVLTEAVLRAQVWQCDFKYFPHRQVRAVEVAFKKPRFFKFLKT